MPYFDQDTRNRLVFDKDAPSSAGQLNSAITRMILKRLGARPCYEDFNAAIGALECAKLELYRRMITSYEDSKIAGNGDIYPTAAPAEFVDGAGLD